MSNSSVSRDVKFGASLGLPGGVVLPAVTLADINGNLIQSFNNGDGTSSLTIGGAGAVTQLTYVSAARTVSNVGDSFTTTSLSQLAVDINVTTFTGGTVPTVVFFVERFGSDSVWYRQWASSALSTAGALSVQMGPFLSGTNVVPVVFTQLARFGWTFAGAPTSITFSASVVGR